VRFLKEEGANRGSIPAHGGTGLCIERFQMEKGRKKRAEETSTKKRRQPSGKSSQNREARGRRRRTDPIKTGCREKLPKKKKDVSILRARIRSLKGR